jgi:hypothetical protein
MAVCGAFFSLVSSFLRMAFALGAHPEQIEIAEKGAAIFLCSKISSKSGALSRAFRHRIGHDCGRRSKDQICV